MGLSESERQGEILRYKALFDEVILVDEAVCSKAAEMKFSATPRLPNIDALIAASASLHNATLVHRDPHFLGIPPAKLSLNSGGGLFAKPALRRVGLFHLAVGGAPHCRLGRAALRLMAWRTTLCVAK